MSFSAPSFSRAALTVAISAVLALAACSSPEGTASSEPADSPSAETSSSPEATPSSAVVPSTDLSGITVTESETGAPVVEVSTPWGISTTQSQVLSPGGSQILTENSTVTLNYVGVNGTNGTEFDSSWTRGTPATFGLGGGLIAGFAKGLVGQAVGSRVLIGIAPADGYTQGSPDAGIEPGDSLIFVVDIISANVEEIAGEEVTPAEGLPTVSVSESGPELSIPEGAAAPADLVVQPLIVGPGAAMTENSSFDVRYRAWNFADGELVVDGWVNQTGALSNMIPGWQQGLLGQTAGSRVMLIVPPALAYPEGQPDGSLAPGQTLVYVIDIYNVTG